MTWAIYGASGYTGRLVARLAVQAGESPLLAGRSATRISALADELGLPYQVVPLDPESGLDDLCSGLQVLVNCAGPFIATAEPVAEACLRTKTHYLDISGEIQSIDYVMGLQSRAHEAGVAMVPAGGFDVVPSDCLARRLHNALPDASELELAVRIDGGVSPGTARSAVRSLSSGGYARVDGELRKARLGAKRMRVDFGDGEHPVASVPLADLVTAYHSTGIGNISTYAALPGGLSEIIGMLSPITGLLGSWPARALLDLAGSLLPGPGELSRQGSGGAIWGRVRSPDGRCATATVSTPNAYELTADAVVAAVGWLRRGRVAPGSHTPSAAFGVDFLRHLDGVVTSEMRLS